jgi:hypothetical protein
VALRTVVVVYATLAPPHDDIIYGRYGRRRRNFVGPAFHPENNNKNTDPNIGRLLVSKCARAVFCGSGRRKKKKKPFSSLFFFTSYYLFFSFPLPPLFCIFDEVEKKWFLNVEGDVRER